MSYPLTIAYTEDYQRWQLGDGHPTNPIRAKLAVELLAGVAEAGGLKGGSAYDLIWPRASKLTLDALYEIHDPWYVNRVMDEGVSGEWAGARKVLAWTAATMFEGTRRLVERMALHGSQPRVYFNPQGAKHHAQLNRSSGFCVFNDMAWAAQHLAKRGLHVLYLDWDVHHGDGVEELCRTNERVMTASIHQYGRGFYPGTGATSQPEYRVYNYPLSTGSGDDALLHGVRYTLGLAREFFPDVVLLACGADGLAEDPLASLEYTHAGIADAASLVGEFAAERRLPVLIGGAGGYTPFDHTPRAWATTVAVIHNALAGITMAA